VVREQRKGKDRNTNTQSKTHKEYAFQEPPPL
jgi:hypothetical protein